MVASLYLIVLRYVWNPENQKNTSFQRRLESLTSPKVKRCKNLEKTPLLRTSPLPLSLSLIPPWFLYSKWDRCSLHISQYEGCLCYLYFQRFRFSSLNPSLWNVSPLEKYPGLKYTLPCREQKKPIANVWLRRHRHVKGSKSSDPRGKGKAFLWSMCGCW